MFIFLLSIGMGCALSSEEHPRILRKVFINPLKKIEIPLLSDQENLRIIQETHSEPSFFISREKRSRKPLIFLQKKEKECFTQTEIIKNIKNLSDCLKPENKNDLKNELNKFKNQEFQWDEKCYLCKSLKPFGGKYRHVTPHAYMGHSPVNVVEISEASITTIRHEIKRQLDK